MYPARAFASRLLENRAEASGVRTLRLETPSDFAFVPGMWVMLDLGDPKHARAYSLATAPSELGSVEVSIGAVGGLSSQLCELQPGARVSARGPYGKWVYEDAIPHAVLISAGTGLSPFRSICRHKLARRLPNKLTVLYSARTPDAILYRDELEAWRAAGISVHVTVSRPEEPASAGWKGPTGKLELADVRRAVPDLGEAVYYLCGPNTLVERLGNALRGAGVPPERVRHEKWGDYSF